MFKRAIGYFLVLAAFTTRAQCPQVYNSLATLTSSPVFVSCTGSAYALNFQSPTSFGSYTINWGDATANTTGAAYVGNSIITHTYPSTVNVYTLTLTIPALSCVLPGTVVVERPVNASIQIPTLGLTTACAPKTLTFTNSSTDVSSTTSFTWNFGGNNPTTFVTTFTNAGQNVTHTYNKGSVNCQTQITLQALNYCSFGNPTIANFNPINIYDKDSAIISTPSTYKCWPDNQFTYTNNSIRNCLPQGNTFQRQERWNFGNYWGKGQDSIVNWRPWPPALPISITYTQPGSYNVVLQDSNFCGVSSRTITVFIGTAPTASLLSPSGPYCLGVPISFTNASSIGFSYRWSDGQGPMTYTNLGGGNKTFTYNTAGTYTVGLIALINGAANSCRDTAFATINVLPSPTASFAATPTVGCNTLTNVVFSNFSSPAAVTNWSFGNGNTSTLTTPPVQNFTTTGLITNTLSVVTASGCVNTFTSALLIRPKPVPAFAQFTTCVGLPITFTNNSAVTGTNAISGYTWTFGDNNSTSNSVSPVRTFSTPGTYTVKLVTTTGFCSDSLTQSVSLNVKPTASFVISPTVGCPPFAITFTNNSINASNYNWNFGTSPAATSTSTNPSFTFSNTTQSFANYTVTLIASTGSGCSDSLKKTISVRPKPVASFTTNTQAGCSPLVTTFSNTSIGLQGSTWSFGDGGISSANNPVHTYTNLSLFTQTVSAKVVVNNSVGCLDSIAQVITIYPEALPQFTMQPSSGCSPLVVNFPGVPGVATYSWSHGDGSPTFTTLSSHTWTFVNTGSVNVAYTVSMTALTSNGCTGGNSQTVSVFANPKAGFVFSPTAACSPATVTFSNTSTGIAASNWTLGNGVTLAQTDAVTAYSNQPGAGSTTFTVTLQVSSANNCRDSITKTVVLYPRPKSVFTADTPACSPQNITFKNNSLDATGYKWDFGDGGTSTVTAASHTFVNSGSSSKKFNIKLVAISANNCFDSSYFELNLHPKPTIFISSSPDSACTPLKVSFKKINGIVKYEWKYDNIAFGSSGDVTNTFINTGTNKKSYTVQLIGSDAFNCSDTATKRVTVYPVPEAKYSVAPLTVYLPNQSVVFTNLSTSAARSQWFFGDGNTSGLIPTSNVYSYTYKNPGEYQTKLIVVNNFGCRDTAELPEKVVAINETTVAVPNAFTPNPSGSKGSYYDPNDLSNDIFYPNVKGADRYLFSVYSRWGELLFETKDPLEGWDGYYKGKLCQQDVYVWKLNVTFLDGRTYSKTGDFLLLR